MKTICVLLIMLMNIIFSIGIDKKVVERIVADDISIIKDTMTIINNESSVKEIMISVYNWPDSTKQVKGKILLEPDNFVLDCGVSKIINIKIIPENDFKEHIYMIYIHNRDKNEYGNNSTKISHNIGTAYYITNETSKVKLDVEIEEIELVNKHISGVLQYMNSGERHLRPQLILSMYNQNEKIEEKTLKCKLPLFVKNGGRIDFNLDKKYYTGKYKLKVKMVNILVGSDKYKTYDIFNKNVIVKNNDIIIN